MIIIYKGVVFLDENQIIKLGDFGLSKALGTASFANTYVGVSVCSRLLLPFSSALCMSDTLLHVT